MSVIGSYDGTAVQVKEPLQMKQKVIVIPIENDTDLGAGNYLRINNGKRQGVSLVVFMWIYIFISDWQVKK